MSEQSQKIVFFCCLVVGGLQMLLASLSVELPSDESIDHEYGKECLKFYKTFGKDKSYADLEVMGRKFQSQ